MDVETNGLLQSRGAKPNKSNVNLFPRIVQFSWGLYNDNGECLKLKNFIIKPDGWDMRGTEKYHGITKDKAITDGIDIKDALTEYQQDLEKCCKMVCHSLDF